MKILSTNQQAFIRMMTRGEEYERHGYDELLKQPDFEAYFDALANAGFFNPAHNRGPVPDDKPGYYRVPYWAPLKYLEAVARRSGETNDLELAEKVMGVVRAVSQWRDAEGKPRDNENTWHSFGDILGFVPNKAIKQEDIGLIANWFTGQFTRSRLGPVFLEGPLKRLIASNDPDDWHKAGDILFHCTTVRWDDDKWPTEPGEKKPVTVIDDYWLKKITSEHAAALGAKLRKPAAAMFVGRVREIFGRHKYDDRSYWSRPAVEDHQQNSGRDDPENRFVEGLRDTLYGWIDVDAEGARPYIAELLADKLDILRRIAIHMLDRRFDKLRELILPALTPELFNFGQLHEVYLLLQNHFPAFSDAEKAATYNAILNLPEIDGDEEGDRGKPSNQKRWLSAFAGKGHFEPADKLYAELNANKELYDLFSHPEFHSWFELRSGFGDTPFEADELVRFANEGLLIDKLNAFTPGDRWNGPSVRSLSDTIIQAVSNKPAAFAKWLPRFLTAKRPYQYAIIAGYKKLWEAWDGKASPAVDWNELWPELIKFFEDILNAYGFWTEEVGPHDTLEPTRRWLPSTIAEFLRAGTKDDKKAYDAFLMPRSWELVKSLLHNAESDPPPETRDALNRAINSELGKAIQALFDHALRWCRLQDAESKAAGAKSHKAIWQSMEPVFDETLQSARAGKFEFFAVAGAYVSNIEYLDKEWFEENFDELFNVQFPNDTLCALDGLAYAPAVGSIYTQLRKTGVIEWALKQDALRDNAREHLLQRIALAYFWDQETLESPRFSYLFEDKRESDLVILTRFFWSVRGQELSDKQIELVIAFWDKSVTWANGIKPTPAQLLSSLSLLSGYLSAIDERGKWLLLAVAPYVSVDYNADRLIEDLARLAKTNPAEASEVLVALLEFHSPSYDFDGDLMALIEALGSNPGSRANALRSAEKIRHLKGGIEFFARLLNAQPRV